jgi:hypothetical protein
MQFWYEPESEGVQECSAIAVALTRKIPLRGSSGILRWEVKQLLLCGGGRGTNTAWLWFSCHFRDVDKQLTRISNTQVTTRFHQSLTTKR